MTSVALLLQKLPDLPVTAVLEKLKDELSKAALCALTAPPGSGKTLLAPSWLWQNLQFDRVYVLVPRRVNARLPVLYLRETLGPLVGYRVRFEQQWDESKTRIGYLTYGTALRTFADSPPGPNDLVIFDEFHERPWEADLLLACLRRSGGPRLLLMSATLDRSGLPESVPLVESDGRLFPVEVSWESSEPMLLARPQELAPLVRKRSAELYRADPGEQLIFLPGIAAIRQVESALAADSLGGPIDVLHSSLPEGEIRRVVERSAQSGFRRILSTDLAESSVTLPGVTVVIDAGLKRCPRRDGFDLGITLETARTPVASLTQRAGRAGRVRAGRCHRLLTRQDERSREPFVRPEIANVGGKTLALHFAALGLLESWRELNWLCPPDADSLAEGQAWLLFHQLVREGELTPRGEAVLSSTCPPRAGLFGVLAREDGWSVDEAVRWTQALSEEGPKSTGEAQELSDRLADKTWSKARDPRLTERLRRVYSFPPHRQTGTTAPICRAYADALVALRGDRAVPAFAQSEALRLRSTHSHTEPFALLLGAVPAGGPGPNSAVSLYLPMSSDQVWEAFLDRMVETVERSWSGKTMSVREHRRTLLGQLVLEEESRDAPAGYETARVFLQNLRAEELGEPYLHFVHRLELFLAHHEQAEEELRSRLPHAANTVGIRDALALDYLQTLTRWNKTSAGELFEHARGLLGYELGRKLEQELPTSVQLPGRRQRTPVHYPENAAPYVASKLQDFFGWTPPRLLGGSLKLACHLLAPSGRPVQITEDLAGFWRGSYAQVRKDLRGRYPKHDWPESPP